MDQKALGVARSETRTPITSSEHKVLLMAAQITLRWWWRVLSLRKAASSMWCRCQLKWTTMGRCCSRLALMAQEEPLFKVRPQCRTCLSWNRSKKKATRTQLQSATAPTCSKVVIKWEATRRALLASISSTSRLNSWRIIASPTQIQTRIRTPRKILSLQMEISLSLGTQVATRCLHLIAARCLTQPVR